MPSFHCPHCQAWFELDDASFPAGTVFDCGGCGREIAVPKVVAPLPKAKPTIAPKKPALAPEPPAEPAAEAAPKIAPRRPAGSSPSARPTAKDLPAEPVGRRRGAAPAQKPGVDRRVLVGGGAGLVILAVVLIALANKGGGAGTSTASGEGTGTAAQSRTEPPKPTDPYDAAWERARASRTLNDAQALSDMAAQRLAKATAGSADAELHDTRLRWACRRILELDPEHREANERLGNVLLDADAIERWIANTSLPADLRKAIEREYGFAAEEWLTEGRRRRWLSPAKRAEKEAAETWGRLRQRVEEATAVASAKASDPFYTDANRVAETAVRAFNMGGMFVRKGVVGEAFHVHIEKPYVVLLQKDAGRGKEELVSAEWARYLLDLDRAFSEHFKDGLPQLARIEPRVVVLLFDGVDYARYLRRDDPSAPILSRAHYEPGTKRVVTYIEPDPDEARSVLFHEGTHQLVDAYMATMPKDRYMVAGLAQALWFSEGIAEYFGAHGLAGFDRDGRRQYRFGGILESGLETIASARKAGDALSVVELLEYSRGRYQQDLGNVTRQRKIGIAYNMGWALCYLLQQWKPETYGAGFAKYFAEEMKGRSGRQAFEAAFGAGSIDQVQKDMDAMLDEIEKARVEKRIRNGRIEK